LDVRVEIYLDGWVEKFFGCKSWKFLGSMNWKKILEVGIEIFLEGWVEILKNIEFSVYCYKKII